jgi:fructosamine-3-kinase
LGKILDFDIGQLQKLRKADGASQTPAFFGVMADGRKVFVKEDVAGSGLLEAEADGLMALRDAEALRVPELMFHSRQWLVMEAIEREAAGAAFWTSLAEGLVRLHRKTGPWGWPRNNFIGRNPQHNKGGQNSWAEFFWEQRILPQLDGLRARKIWTAAEEKWLGVLEDHVLRILADVHEPPSLLHGDLWSGNVLCGKEQTPILIDPAVYYGHRETDLAMTELFGGFARSFYQRYKELWPLAPGYPARRLVYNFYHKLNHANLYGSGYIWDVKKTLLDVVKLTEAQPPMAENV